MLLVADAGSTKADWFLSDGKEVKGRYNTIGINPYFHNADFIYNALSSSGELGAVAQKISEVRYFGAGCSSEERNKIVEEGLKRFFINAKIHVDHDLMASAYATCGNNEGISCILGTGSNSCYFDGKRVHERNYGLGYILGDEGSGSYYGKKLVTTFLYGLMPSNIYSAFSESFHLNKDSIIENVYGRPNANVWLASLSRFLKECRHDPFIQKLLHKGMSEFLELYVCNYENYKNIPVHFVGSIAHVYQDELKAAALQYDITIGKIIRRPIEDLVGYFIGK
jgi:N-acetylglucosamine kinase-like BadF-type ATPase